MPAPSAAQVLDGGRPMLARTALAGETLQGLLLDTLAWAKACTFWRATAVMLALCAAKFG